MPNPTIRAFSWASHDEVDEDEYDVDAGEEVNELGYPLGWTPMRAEEAMSLPAATLAPTTCQRFMSACQISSDLKDARIAALEATVSAPNVLFNPTRPYELRGGGSKSPYYDT